LQQVHYDAVFTLSGHRVSGLVLCLHSVRGTGTNYFYNSQPNINLKGSKDMNGNYHSEIVNLSQNNTNIFNEFNVIGVRKRFLGFVKIYKISIPENDLSETLTLVQHNMSRKLGKEWYATFHNADKAIVIFREKAFSLFTIGIIPEYQKCLSTDSAKEKQQWNEMLNYAKALGIPNSQLDFLPPDFMTEAY
jgi:hypothetical protein